MFSPQYYFKDGDNKICVCFDCKNSIENQKKLDEETEKKRTEDAANKKALEKNCQYEYKIVNLRGVADLNSGLNAIGNRLNPKDESILNEMGVVGWELVAAVPMNSMAPRLGHGSPSATEWVSCIFRRKI
jgi:hypothetical protein